MTRDAPVPRPPSIPEMTPKASAPPRPATSLTERTRLAALAPSGSGCLDAPTSAGSTASRQPSPRSGSRRPSPRHTEITTDIEEPDDVSRGALLTWFDFVNVITAVAAAMLGAAHVASLVDYATSAPETRATLPGVVAAAQLVYQLIFCAAIVAGEMGVLPADESPLATFWVLRGLAYGFVGLLSLPVETKTPAEAPQDLDAALAEAKGYAAIGLCGAGLLYALMGICCCRRLRAGARRCGSTTEIAPRRASRKRGHRRPPPLSAAARAERAAPGLPRGGGLARRPGVSRRCCVYGY
mmetsp:Transcript_2898/g.8486  ORF Transcript_2898/g.8486 Transcript_2898/m.8486 type:complete len:297 (-) Transcript_2898:22-912(-)